MFLAYRPTKLAFLTTTLAALLPTAATAAATKLIVPDPRNRPDAKPELYDLQSDPWERTDLAAQRPERVRALTKQLDGWWTPPANAN